MRVKDLFNMSKKIFNNDIEVICENDVIEGYYEITPSNLSLKAQNIHFKSLS